MHGLRCQVTNECTGKVSHIDNKGYVYCESCGLSRRSVRPCRKMRQWEIRLLEQGQCISWNPRRANHA